MAYFFLDETVSSPADSPEIKYHITVEVKRIPKDFEADAKNQPPNQYTTVFKLLFEALYGTYLHPVDVDKLPTAKDLIAKNMLIAHSGQICEVFKRLKQCVANGFGNGEGKSFVKSLLKLMVANRLCSSTEITQEIESKSTYHFESTSSDTGKNQKSSLSRKPRKSVENYNLNCRYADVVLNAYTAPDHEELIPRVVAEIKSDSSHAELKKAVKQVFSFGLAASKQKNNSSVLLLVFTPCKWLYSWFSPNDKDVKFYSYEMLSEFLSVDMELHLNLRKLR